MTAKYCAGPNCNATHDGLVPHSSKCFFEHMCAIKGMDTTVMPNFSGEYFDHHTQEAWERWQWAWDAARKGTALEAT